MTVHAGESCWCVAVFVRFSCCSRAVLVRFQCGSGVCISGVFCCATIIGLRKATVTMKLTGMHVARAYMHPTLDRKAGKQANRQTGKHTTR